MESPFLNIDYERENDISRNSYNKGFIDGYNKAVIDAEQLKTINREGCAVMITKEEIEEALRICDSEYSRCKKVHILLERILTELFEKQQDIK